MKKNLKQNFNNKRRNNSDSSSDNASSVSLQDKLFGTDENLCKITESSLNIKSIKLDTKGNLVKEDQQEILYEKKDMVDSKSTFNDFTGDLSYQEIAKNPNISQSAKKAMSDLIYKSLHPFSQNSSKSFAINISKDQISYTNLNFLTSKAISNINFSITPPRMTGLKSKEQKLAQKAIKIARFLALIPYCNSNKAI